ncbi:MAG: hypothetical protein DRP13_02330 [Candidatus Aenigmatarchaeota archaeon]|nr:MAG: hypothetical protein DRP13_02330 [Candidatus Aenigmarchaeota archaeon]
MGNITFDDLLKQKVYTTYSDFVSEIPHAVSKEVRENIKRERKLVKDIRNHESFKKMTIRHTNKLLPKAEKLLLSGNVVGVDGTIAKLRLFSGVRCQVGIVAVNYVGEQIKHSFFISHADLRDEPKDVLDRIARRMEIDDELPEMALRGFMLYREREVGLHTQFKGKYIMYHGPLLPFELMSGLGRLRALETTLEILRKIVKEKRCFSVISGSRYIDYSYYGMAIQKGEYLTKKGFDLYDHLANTTNFMRYRSKWRDEEREMIEEFLENYARKIQIGVIRIGERPYVFHAHKENFDLAAAIIARDSMFQREKGFPLLIDYADALCTEYFSAGQFKNMMKWELAKNNSYLLEAEEREMRNK